MPKVQNFLQGARVHEEKEPAMSRKDDNIKACVVFLFDPLSASLGLASPDSA